MRTIKRIVVGSAIGSLFIGTMAHAAITGLTRVASGLNSPMFVTAPPGDRNRLFIMERGTPAGSTNASASIKILDLTTGVLSPTPFLTIPGVDNRGEGGLLGMAFDPNYATNRKFYVYLTAGDSDPNTYFTSYIRQYTASLSDPNVADTTATPIFSWGQPESNHNGGWIGFSPVDHLLYIGSGDGGGGNDQHGTSGNGQNTGVPLGKMLRIDVSSDGFPSDPNKNYAIPSTNPFKTGSAPEVWDYGLRNPFRDSFDRITGDLWMGDVGQDNREEIDVHAANTAGGKNYGWHLREGDIATPGVGGTCSTCTEPVYTYTHPSTSVPPVSPVGYTGVVVTGGYVYKGPDPSLQGQYFFFDSQNTTSTGDDNYWWFNPSNVSRTVANINSLLTADTGLHQFPVSMGEDAVGNLYIAYLVSGEVYRINTNQLLPGDYDADGDVDIDDYNLWRKTFGTSAGSRPADGNGNGIVDMADYIIWRKNLGRSVSGAGFASSVATPELGAAALAAQAAILFAMAARRRRS